MRSLSTPSLVEVATMVATSSTVKALVASSLGSTLKQRSTPLAVEFNATMMGRNTIETATSGGARMSAARSGTENERFFGTISPTTTCRKVTITSATTKPIVPIASTGSGVSPSGISTRWWIAGSATLRISSEHTVIPSWLVASMSVACSIA